MKYKIEKNIPIPETRRRHGSKWDFVKSLDNGDSFVIDTIDRNCLYQYCKNNKIETVTRVLHEYKKEKVRVWVYTQK